MAKINQQPPRTPLWPWGGPRSIKERLVDPAQLARVNANKTGKKGDPKNPALPSSALMDSIGPAHTSEELRLPLPPHPRGHDADLTAFTERPHLQAAAQRAGEEQTRAIEKRLATLNAPPDRVERLRALIAREQQMMALISDLHGEMDEIQRKMREEQKELGY